MYVAVDASADILASPETSKHRLPRAEARADKILAINSAMTVKDMVQIENTATSACALFVIAVGTSRYRIKCSGELQDPFHTKKPIIVSLRKSRLSWSPRYLLLNKKFYTRMTKTQHGSASSERMLSFLYFETMGDIPLSWPTLSIQYLATALTEHSVHVTIGFQVSCHL